MRFFRILLFHYHSRFFSDKIFHLLNMNTNSLELIIIPMIGMVQSLNVSVASALILYEAQRQRQNAGMYLRENSMLPEAEQQRLLFEGGYPVLAKVAKRKGLPYPHVNQQGEIEADADWWATMQAAG